MSGNAPDLPAEDFESKTVSLAGDLTLNSPATNSVGTEEHPFRGTFDGGGFTVSGFRQGENEVVDYAQGFFGFVDGATIQNLTVAGAIQGVPSVEAGGIVAKALSDITVKNCISEIEMTDVGHGGGIVGQMPGGVLENCLNRGTISATGRVGGILSQYGAETEFGDLLVSSPLTMIDCVNSGNLSSIGVAYIGGVVGDLSEISSEGASYLLRCGNSGNLRGYRSSNAGVVGLLGPHKLEACYNIGTIENGNKPSGIAVLWNTNKPITLVGCYNGGAFGDECYRVGALVYSVPTNLTLDHSYYLTTAIQGQSVQDSEASKSLTPEQVASGEAAFLLDLGDEAEKRINQWTQREGVPAPRQDGEKGVYRVTGAEGITFESAYVKAGEPLTLTVTPPDGQVVELLTVCDVDGNILHRYGGAGGETSLPMPESDVTMQVRYVNIPDPTATFTVRFAVNGGSAVADQHILAGNTIEWVTSTRSGFEFWGWYLDAGFTRPFEAGTLITGDITLYARWKTEGKFSVRFEVEGGSPVPGEQFVSSGGRVTEPDTPTRSADDIFRYELLGWYASVSAKEPWNFETPVTRDMTLRARWQVVSRLDEGVTPEAPYQIMNQAGLKQLAKEVSGGKTFADRYFVLGDDIVLTGWNTSIGVSSTPFQGSFSGNGHTIDLGTAGVPLFDTIGAAGKISGLVLRGTPQSTSWARYGSVAMQNSGTISNCSAELAVSTVAYEYGNTAQIGGIAYGNSGTVENCTVKMTLETTTGLSLYGIGGIVYSQSNGTITGCVLEEDSVISGPLAGNLGGIVAQVTGGTVINCQNYGELHGTQASNTSARGVGGIAGYYSANQSKAAFSGCKNYGAVSASPANVAVASLLSAGGIIGYSGGTQLIVEDCVNSGEVYGHFASGGILGSDRRAGTSSHTLVIRNCRNENAPVETRDAAPAGIGGNCDYAGGIVGRMEQVATLTIENCENNQAVSTKPVVPSKSAAGGIVGCWEPQGYNTKKITGSVNRGEITGMTAGGIAGIFKDARIETSQNHGKVTAYTDVDYSILLGGIVGSGNATDCANYGEVVVGDSKQPGAAIQATGVTLGGIAGDATGQISKCFSRGAVRQYCAKSANVGGVAGFLSATPTQYEFAPKDSYFYGEAPKVATEGADATRQGAFLGGINSGDTVAFTGCYFALKPVEGELPAGVTAIITDKFADKENGGLSSRAATDFTSGKVAYELGEKWSMDATGAPVLADATHLPIQKVLLDTAGGSAECKLVLTSQAAGYESFCTVAAGAESQAERYMPQFQATVSHTLPAAYTELGEDGVNYRYEYAVESITATPKDGEPEQVQSGAVLAMTDGLTVSAVFRLDKTVVPPVEPDPEPDPKPDPKPDPEPDPGQGGNGDGEGGTQTPPVTEPAPGDGNDKPGSTESEGATQPEGGELPETPTNQEATEPEPESGGQSKAETNEQSPDRDTQATPQPPVDITEVEQEPPTAEPVETPAPAVSQPPAATTAPEAEPPAGLDIAEPEEQEEEPVTIFEVVRKAVQENPAILIATGGGLTCVFASAAWFRYRKFKKS